MYACAPKREGKGKEKREKGRKHLLPGRNVKKIFIPVCIFLFFLFSVPFFWTTSLLALPIFTKKKSL